MSQQSQRISSLSPADLPMKRKRGRPRKDENLVLGKNKSITPASGSMRKNKESGGDTSDGAMVGQVVTGVIEGSFDAGYLLNVKVGDTDTHLRGVVFLPGRFTPITAANDVAPHVKMYDRKEIPIPILNRQTQLHNYVPPSGGQSSKQPTELKSHAPELPDQLQPPGLQSAIPKAPENMVTVAANSPKNDASLSLAGNEVPQKTSEPGLVSQSTSTTAQPNLDKIVEHDEVLKECEASPLIEGANLNGEATKESKAESASEPVVDMVPAAEIATKEPQIQHQAVNRDLKPNELVHNEVKNPNLKLSHASVFAEPKPMSSEQMNKPADIVMEEQASPQEDIVEETQLEPAIENSSGTDTSLSNGEPATDPVNATELGSHSPPQSSQTAMMSAGEAIPSESNQPTSKESALKGMMEPHLHISGTANNMENGVKDDPVPQC